MNDVKMSFNPLPYNIQDKNPNNNRQGLMPSYQYKKNRILWLNSAFATTSIANGTTYYELSYDVPPFQLYNQTKLKVVSYISNESNAKIIIIKLKNLMYDNNSTYNSDKEAYPTLFVGHTGVASQMNNNQYSLTLVPQLVSNITISLSDTLSTRNAGFTISGGGAGNFILGLLFEDMDLEIDNAVSPYK
jgi:hypothetical protein